MHRKKGYDSTTADQTVQTGLALLHAVNPDRTGANSRWVLLLPLGLVFIDSYTEIQPTRRLLT